jgi:quercetin dioxygenase-like cupin family protein
MGSALLSFENESIDERPARSVLFQGALITFHASSTDTSGQFALVEAEGGPGCEPPPHIHRNEDELFYVLEGTLKVLRGDKEITLGPGESAFLPRNVIHTFKIISKHARFLVYITPGGFESYFRDLGQAVTGCWPEQTRQEPITTAEMIRVAARYSITLMP